MRRDNWHGRRPVRWATAVAACASLLCVARPAGAIDYSWNDPAGGTFTNASSWLPFDPPNGVQGPGGHADAVIFDLGVAPASRYTVSGLAGTNDRMLILGDSLTLNLPDGAEDVDYLLDNGDVTTPGFTVGAGGDLVLTGGAGAVFQAVNSAIDGGGVLSVRDVAWNTTARLDVGNAGNGSLEITDGGSASSFAVSVGSLAGSSGQVTVSGAGSTWASGVFGPDDVHIGAQGTGSLTIEQGGAVSGGEVRVGRFAGGTGTVLVTGTGSTWTPNSVSVGHEGTGTVTVTDGADVQASGLSIGFGSTATGNVTVSGAGSTFNATGVSVGGAGSGTLTIEQGGRFEGFEFRIGNPFGSGTGTVLVRDPGSTLVTTDALYVTGASGSLRIENGARAESHTFAHVGFGEGAVGSATVTGAGSTWAVDLSISVGWDGRGQVRVEDGALLAVSRDAAVGVAGGQTVMSTLAVSNATMSVGRDAIVGFSAFGELTIDQSASVSVDGTFTVGDGERGSLLIETGGDLTSGSAVIGNGFHTAGNSANLRDAGSTWSIAGDLTVGNEGLGTLSLRQGAAVSTTGAATFAQAPGSRGDVSVALGDATLAIGGDLTVGDAGDADFTVGTGGHATTAGDAVIAAAAGSEGFASVSGPGATWDVAGDLTVGGLGTADLFVGDTGVLSVGTGPDGGSLTVGPSGTLFGTGTVVGDVTNGGLVFPDAFPVPTGTFQIDGDFTQSADGTLRIELASPAAGDFDRLAVTGQLALDGTLDVILADGYVPALGHSFDVLDALALTGTFQQLNLPPLGAGLSWDTSDLYTTGTLAVVVPEPLTAWPLLAALLIPAHRRRRGEC